MTVVFQTIEVVGIVAFALSGAMTAIEQELDLLGVMLIGIVASLFGGIMRDILIGSLPPRVFSHTSFIAIAAFASLSIFFIAYRNRRLYLEKREWITKINNVFDALGLGAFSVSGVQTAINAGYGGHIVLAVSLGMLPLWAAASFEICSAV